MTTSQTVPIPRPANTVLRSSQAVTGVILQPISHIQAMSPDEWQDFVVEWADSLRIRGVYTDVHKPAGAYDQGRDVIGYKGTVSHTSAWDNYQCKHYGQSLNIADVVSELGKLIYFASLGEFVMPDAYIFVAPKGPSTHLLKCLERGNLKDELISRWNAECKTKITQTRHIEITYEIQSIIDTYDFTKITVLPPQRLIEEHRQTPYFAFRFGGGLPPRQPIPDAPTSVQPHESKYVDKLLAAYGDAKGRSFANIESLNMHCPALAKHLQRSREQFFSAEALRTFSRDTVPPGTFEALQTEIHDGIQDTYLAPYDSGYRRVLETVKAARNLQITDNALIDVTHTQDRAGICHQLANEDRVDWVHLEVD